MEYSEARGVAIDRDRCCFLCMQERGEIRPIEEVHHVVPRSQWGRNNKDKHNPKNLVGVCRNCHSGHKPHIESHEMIVFILSRLKELYGYTYEEAAYKKYRVEMMEHAIRKSDSVVVEQD